MKLADAIAAKVAASLGYDEEKRAVMAYGLCAILQMAELLLIALLFGLIFKCLPETMIIFWGVGLLKRSTGGAHCKSYMACIFTSSLSICLLSFACRYLLPGWLNKHYCFLAGMLPALCVFTWIAWKRVPVASENKPIENPAKIARLRRQCLITMIIYLLAAIGLLAVDWEGKRNISAYWSLTAVIWWQALMLTEKASHVTGFMDRLFI